MISQHQCGCSVGNAQFCRPAAPISYSKLVGFESSHVLLAVTMQLFKQHCTAVYGNSKIDSHCSVYAKVQPTRQLQRLLGTSRCINVAVWPTF